MATITKKELIDRIADSTGGRRVQVKKIVQQFLDVTPSTNLKEGQTVALTGGGWPANKTLYATECAVGPGIFLSEQTCDPRTQQQFQTDGAGNVTGQFKVTRSLAVDLGSGLTTRDCAVEACGLVGVVWHGEVGNVGDGNILMAHGIPTVQYGAGDIRIYKEWPTPDERVPLKDLVTAARAIAYATHELCA